MSIRLRFTGVAILLAVSMHGLLSAQSPHGAPGVRLQPGPNVNAVGGVADPTDPAALVKSDLNAQRQNETMAAASVRNPDHVLAVANDYRFVDFPQDQYYGGQQSFIARLVARVLGKPARRALPAAAAAVGAWTGVYRSCDRGRTWIGSALPGSPLDFSDASKASPLKALSNLAIAQGGHAETTDPVLVAGPQGRMHLVVLGFVRFPNGMVGDSRMYYASYTDRNNREGGTCFSYDYIRQIDAGSNHRTVSAPAPFVDKPTVAVDADGTIYTAYTVFLDAVKSKIVIARSTDGGVTWSRTTPLLSIAALRNHGASITINPQNGIVYVAWRTFYNEWPLMVMSQSFDRGRTFFPATPIHQWWPARSLSQIVQQLRASKLQPFDQFSSGNPMTARSLAFPTLVAGVVNGRTRLFAAWAERADVTPGSATFGAPSATGSPRVMLTMSSDGGLTWTPRRAVDAQPRTEELLQPGVGPLTTRASGPQLQPILSISGLAAPQLLLMYYESRGELTEPFATSFVSGIERQVDVRAARLDPATGQLLAPSVQVSQYGIESNSSPASLAETVSGFPAVNRQNLPMYQGGLAAFFGDYPHISPSRAFEYAGGRWRWASEAPTSIAMWTDNRDVEFPLDSSGAASIAGNWQSYTPLVPTLGGAPAPSCAHVGSRNANPYFSELGGVIAGAPQTFKPLTIQRAFATYVENRTPQDRFFRLTIADNEAAGVDGSFEQFDFSPASDVRDVAIFAHSSQHRTVWVQPLLNNLTASLQVVVQEISEIGGPIVPAGLRSRVLLNPDPGNDALMTIHPTDPSQGNPAITAENSELHNPQISSPQIATFRISSPQIASPQIASPQIASPQIASPQIATPQIASPQIASPQIATPQISTASPEEAANGTDITYTVTNRGTTTSTYEALFNVPNVQALIGSGNYQFQLLVTRTSLVPGYAQGPNGCQPAAKTDVHVITNIPVPQIASPQIATLNNPQIASPQIATPQISTFSVAPSGGAEQEEASPDSHSVTIPDEVKVTLRVIRLRPLETIRAENGPEFAPEQLELRVQSESTNVVLGVVEPDGSQPTTITNPDFAVADYTVAGPALSAPPGGTVTLSSWTLRNQGTQGTTGSTLVSYYLSADPTITSADILLTSTTFGALDPGEEISVGPQLVTIPGATAPGTYYVGILIDGGNAVAESNELNNFVSEVVIVSAPVAAARAYVVHPGDGEDPGSLSVIDVGSSEVLTSVAVGVSPTDVALTPDNTRAFVTNFGSSSVSVIDLATNAVITTIPDLDNPTGVVFNPAGTRAYVVSAGGSVYVLDAATYGVITSVAVGIAPNGAAVTPNGSYVYVANQESNTVSRIDTSTNTAVGAVAVGSVPLNIVMTPDGSKAYVTNQASDNVSVIDTATFTVIATIAVGSGPNGIGIKTDGSEVFVANFGSASITRISTATNTSVGSLDFPGFPYDLAFSPTHTYVTAYVDGSLKVIDLATNEEIVSIATGSSPTAVAFRPGGE